MSDSQTYVPEVLWAQRSSDEDASKNFVYLTLSVPDVSASDLKLDLRADGLTFTGTSSTLKRTYHVDLAFYAEIDPEASVSNHTAKNVEFKLQKKELSSEYWPRLLKDTKKMHFLKTDFDKWVDEDEQDPEADDEFSQFGGGDMGGMPGMPGMGGMGGMPGMGGDFGGIDFSKLGDMSSMAGLGGEEPDHDHEGESDEDDLPELVSDETSTSAPASTEAAASTDAPSSTEAAASTEKSA